MSSNPLSQKPKPPQLLNFTLELMVAIAIGVLLTISVSLILVHVAKQLKCSPAPELLPIKLPLKDVPTID
ncbi:MAG TPA: hypothetical protein DDW76_28730 [Cyanobacteria bacterium UBA11369]|nr:hypothetical protein [Cyanobacteria bacterium UBA11367]HBE31420.1 hypothetical protein [Cyanobacteria bacterium UBA11368]HBE52646.1 hypothetical protein [Cyanobacteria bacterium UBA11369]